MQPHELRAVRADADRPRSTPARCRWRGSTTPSAAILTKKFELGLFEHPYTDRTLPRPRSATRAHRALARRAVAEVAGAAARTTATRCRSRGGSTVYVAGSNADNIGNQAGGWTLTWQGGSTNVIPGHDDPRRHPADAARGNVTYSADASAPIAPHADRHRRGRRDAVRRGLRRRRRPAVGLRPGRQQRAAAGEEHAAVRRRQGGGRQGLRRRRGAWWWSSPAGR